MGCEVPSSSLIFRRQDGDLQEAIRIFESEGHRHFSNIPGLLVVVVILFPIFFQSVVVIYLYIVVRCNHCNVCSS